MPQHVRNVIANIDRLNAYMNKNGLAAVAVRTGVNFTYLSNGDARHARAASGHRKYGSRLHGSVAAPR
jgi:hypothetical protein